MTSETMVVVEPDVGVIRVWDPLVRLFHWSLVAAVTVAAVTAMVLPPTWVTSHIVAGTIAVALVGLRIIWGFVGTGPARFTSFVHAPGVVLRHFQQLRQGVAHRHIGHNPLGGTMIVGLMTAIVVLALSGAIALGGTLKSGPLAFATSFATGEVWRQIHQLLAYGLLGLIGAHIVGVLVESRRTDDSLVRAMIDGRKEARPGDIVPPVRQALVLTTAAIAVVALVASAAVIFALSLRPAMGVPTAPLDPLYAEECGACHFAYHPSLAPAATWEAILAGLSSHFGENAELDPAEVVQLRTYLLANSADAFDTKAANRLRRTDPADPLRIIATPFWQRTHRRIPEAVFASKAVGSRGACNACHRDAASGLFEPSSIHVPEEAGS
jgi:cytochrome b